MLTLPAIFGEGTPTVLRCAIEPTESSRERTAASDAESLDGRATRGRHYANTSAHETHRPAP